MQEDSSFSLREICRHNCFLGSYCVLNVFFHVPNYVLQGYSQKHHTFIPYGLPKVLPFSCVYINRWAKGETLHLHVKKFIFRSFKSFNFFFFVLDNDPIKMGPHLINRSNNHRHKCVWASPTIFWAIYGSGWGEWEREKKRNGVIQVLYNLHLRPLVDLMSLSIWSY